MPSCIWPLWLVLNDGALTKQNYISINDLAHYLLKFKATYVLFTSKHHPWSVLLNNIAAIPVVPPLHLVLLVLGGAVEEELVPARGEPWHGGHWRQLRMVTCRPRAASPAAAAPSPSWSGSAPRGWGKLGSGTSGATPWGIYLDIIWLLEYLNHILYISKYLNRLYLPEWGRLAAATWGTEAWTGTLEDKTYRQGSLWICIYRELKTEFILTISWWKLKSSSLMPL